MKQLRQYNRINRLLNSVSRGFLDILFPPICPISRESVDQWGALSPSAWSALSFLGGPACTICAFPFEYDFGKTAICGVCETNKPAYDASKAALIYDDKSRRLILPFKHGDQTYLAKSLSKAMFNAGKEILNDADILIPVPLHRRKLWMRRYNQAGILAKYLGAMSDKNIIHDVLIRTRWTGTQGYLRRKQRQANVSNAFGVYPGKEGLIKGKKICLIDDVYTSGSTLHESAKALKKAGASHVSTLCFARVCK